MSLWLLILLLNLMQRNPLPELSWLITICLALLLNSLCDWSNALFLFHWSLSSEKLFLLFFIAHCPHSSLFLAIAFTCHLIKVRDCRGIEWHIFQHRESCWRADWAYRYTECYQQCYQQIMSARLGENKKRQEKQYVTHKLCTLSLKVKLIPWLDVISRCYVNFGKISYQCIHEKVFSSENVK